MTKTPDNEEELHDQLFKIVVVNVTEKETGRQLYALEPFELIDFITQYTDNKISEAYKKGALDAYDTIDDVEQQHLITTHEELLEVMSDKGKTL